MTAPRGTRAVGLGVLRTGIAGFAGGVVTVALLGTLAWITGLPWLFPSLAPTTLLMFETPGSRRPARVMPWWATGWQSRWATGSSWCSGCNTPDP